MQIKRDNITRQYKCADRSESAARTIGDITKGCDILGMTKGQFSKIDIIKHVINEIGACHLVIGTWTAAAADIRSAEILFRDDKILSCRAVVDRSFPTRQPKYYKSFIDVFGEDSVALMNFHAKFAIFKNDNFNIVLRTSMNLNLNKRIEMYEISDSKVMHDMFEDIVDDHFNSQTVSDNFSKLKFKTGQSVECDDLFLTEI